MAESGSIGDIVAQVRLQAADAQMAARQLAKDVATAEQSLMALAEAAGVVEGQTGKASVGMNRQGESLRMVRREAQHATMAIAFMAMTMIQLANSGGASDKSMQRFSQSMSQGVMAGFGLMSMLQLMGIEMTKGTMLITALATAGVALGMYFLDSAGKAERAKKALDEYTESLRGARIEQLKMIQTELQGMISSQEKMVADAKAAFEKRKSEEEKGAVRGGVRPGGLFFDENEQITEQERLLQDYKDRAAKVEDLLGEKRLTRFEVEKQMNEAQVGAIENRYDREREEINATLATEIKAIEESAATRQMKDEAIVAKTNEADRKIGDVSAAEYKEKEQKEKEAQEKRLKHEYDYRSIVEKFDTEEANARMAMVSSEYEKKAADENKTHNDRLLTLRHEYDEAVKNGVVTQELVQKFQTAGFAEQQRHEYAIGRIALDREGAIAVLKAEGIRDQRARLEAMWKAERDAVERTETDKELRLAKIAKLDIQHQQDVYDMEISQLDQMSAGIDQLGNALHRAFKDGGDEGIQKMLAMLQIAIQIDKILKQSSNKEGGMGLGEIASLAANVISIAALFDSGGYTGGGSRTQPAGIVHAGEFVFEKSVTDKNLPDLVALRAQMQGGISLQDAMAASAMSAKSWTVPSSSVLRAASDGGMSPAFLVELRALRKDVQDLDLRQEIVLNETRDWQAVLRKHLPNAQDFLKAKSTGSTNAS